MQEDEGGKEKKGKLGAGVFRRTGQKVTDKVKQTFRRGDKGKANEVTGDELPSPTTVYPSSLTYGSTPFPPRPMAQIDAGSDFTPPQNTPSSYASLTASRGSKQSSTGNRSLAEVFKGNKSMTNLGSTRYKNASRSMLNLFTGDKQPPVSSSFGPDLHPSSPGVSFVPATISRFANKPSETPKRFAPIARNRPIDGGHEEIIWVVKAVKENDVQRIVERRSGLEDVVGIWSEFMREALSPVLNLELMASKRQLLDDRRVYYLRNAQPERIEYWRAFATTKSPFVDPSEYDEPPTEEEETMEPARPESLLEPPADELSEGAWFSGVGLGVTQVVEGSGSAGESDESGERGFGTMEPPVDGTRTRTTTVETIKARDYGLTPPQVVVQPSSPDLAEPKSSSPLFSDPAPTVGVIDLALDAYTHRQLMHSELNQTPKFVSAGRIPTPPPISDPLSSEPPPLPPKEPWVAPEGFRELVLTKDLAKKGASKLILNQLVASRGLWFVGPQNKKYPDPPRNTSFFFVHAEEGPPVVMAERAGKSKKGQSDPVIRVLDEERERAERAYNMHMRSVRAQALRQRQIDGRFDYSLPSLGSFRTESRYAFFADPSEALSVWIQSYVRLEKSTDKSLLSGLLDFVAPLTSEEAASTYDSTADSSLDSIVDTDIEFECPESPRTFLDRLSAVLNQFPDPPARNANGDLEHMFAVAEEEQETSTSSDEVREAFYCIDAYPAEAKEKEERSKKE